MFTLVDTDILHGYHVYISAIELPNYARTLQEGSEYIKIPGLPIDAITFQVPSADLSPTLEVGDYASCILHAEHSPYDPSGIYVVVSESGVYFRHVEQAHYHLILSAPHQPIIRLSIAEVKEVWQVVLRTTRHLALPPTPIPDDRLARLEAFLAKHFPDWKP